MRIPGQRVGGHLPPLLHSSLIMESAENGQLAPCLSRRWWGGKYLTEWLIATVAALLILPLLALLALLVKLTSPGPVFYVTPRLGKHERTFSLYKFRSMSLNVPEVLGSDGKVLTLPNDPRLSPIGKFLRLGFDELPQLFNVIKGEMCLIGPRPDVPRELERYTPRQTLRLAVLPGITGLAQVLGGRELNNAQNYELDVRYVCHANFITDALILAVTLPYSLGATRIGQRIFGCHLEAVVPNLETLHEH